MITLPIDCLYQIFQHFKDDIKTLHSCLLSSRSCCELIIPILWSDPWRLIQKKKSTPEKYKLSSISLLSILLSRLPFESKRLLHDNHVHWTSQTTFLNYITYCRSLDFYGILDMLDAVSLHYQPFGILHKDIKTLVGQEICKMIILQSTKITHMNISEMSYSFFDLFQHLSLNDSQSLSHLNEFKYQVTENSNIPNFYNMFNVCKNISNLIIYLGTTPSESFIDLIRSQNAIKFMDIIFEFNPPSKLINSLLLHFNTLTHLYISCSELIFSKIFSVYPTFSNLRFLKYRFYDDNNFYVYNEDVKNKDISLPSLEILEFESDSSFSYRIMAQIIQGTQGKLERIYMSYPDYDENPSIINQYILKSCPNLKVLTTVVNNATLDIVLAILTCQNLEGIALYSSTDEINSILNHLSLHPLKNLLNLKFINIDSWTFSTKNMKLFLKTLEKEELVKKLNISLIYLQIDIDSDKIIDLFEAYYLKGIIASYFIEEESDIIDDFDDWQRILI
ncbi:6502_t:CDS:1 [Dentiscutata erythropus]|uniref:6502_t:CDS:1 n=1 Tax=Dentiscutata erythropus TaxID=1348616 RepID=A0A9N9NKA5_9GLOM|nr:6502_t:CDS:1 [Dentiscutata erythropus]